MLRICRICLVKTEYFLELETGDESLHFKLVYCVPEMAETINEDAVICRACAHSLELAYLFVKKCLLTVHKINATKIRNEETLENLDDIILDVAVEETPIKRQKINRLMTKQTFPNKQTESNFSHTSKTKSVMSSIDKNLLSILNTNESIFNFEYHLDRAMAISKGRKCTCCNEKFITELDLEKHMEIHKEAGKNLESEELNCRYCRKPFSRVENLLFHENMHNKPKLFHCNTCNEMFDTQIALMSHLELHRQKESCDTVSECELCGKFFHVKCLERHSDQHLKENCFKCIYCNCNFEKKGFLIYHLKLHTEEEKASVFGGDLSNCNMCNNERGLEKIQGLKVEITDTVVGNSDTVENYSNDKVNVFIKSEPCHDEEVIVENISSVVLHGGASQVFKTLHSKFTGNEGNSSNKILNGGKSGNERIEVSNNSGNQITLTDSISRGNVEVNTMKLKILNKLNR